MKVIDMHCDTIMALYHDQKEGKYSELRTNDYNISIEKMEKGPGGGGLAPLPDRRDM